MKVTIRPAPHSGYYCVRYEGLVDYVDGRYVERVT